MGLQMSNSLIEYKNVVNEKQKMFILKHFLMFIYMLVIKFDAQEMYSEFCSSLHSKFLATLSLVV